MKPTYEQLEQQLAAVVAENAVLKSKGRELLNEACKVYEKLNSTITSDSGDFMDGQTLHEFQFLLDADTTATDAYLAEVRAQGADKVATACRWLADKDGCSVNMQCSYNLTAERAEAIAAQLRQGAKHE